MNEKLPTTIGELLPAEGGLTLHSADSYRFDPVAHWAKPEVAEQTFVPPQATVVPMPISLLPSTSFIPKEYQVHIHSQLCLNCNSGHEWTCSYAFNEITARLGSGKHISNLVPVERFSYNVPVRVLRAPVKTVPACQECARENLNLSHLPRPADTEEYKRIIAAYQQPGNIATSETRKEPMVAKSATGAKPAKKPLTIDDLI